MTAMELEYENSWLDKLKAALTQRQEAEPVAVIGDAFSILWIGRGSIAPIIERNGLKVGDKLCARPPKPTSHRVMRGAEE